MTAHLLTCAEFRVLRDQLALDAARVRYPLLLAEIKALEADVLPLLKAMRGETSKHEREKIYARVEGRDLRLQNLSFERDALEKRLLKATPEVAPPPE